MLSIALLKQLRTDFAIEQHNFGSSKQVQLSVKQL